MEPKYLKNGVFSEKIEKYTIENSNLTTTKDEKTNCSNCSIDTYSGK